MQTRNMHNFLTFHPREISYSQTILLFGCSAPCILLKAIFYILKFVEYFENSICYITCVSVAFSDIMLRRIFYIDTLKRFIIKSKNVEKRTRRSCILRWNWKVSSLLPSVCFLTNKLRCSSSDFLTGLRSWEFLIHSLSSVCRNSLLTCFILILKSIQRLKGQLENFL